MSDARQEGQEEGINEGREVSVTVGRIQMLQELLGDPPTGTEDPAELAMEEPSGQLATLQQRLRDRQG